VIPVSAPIVGEREAAYVAECLDTGWISSNGRFIDAFEEAWAEYCGRRYSVSVANGTVALQLAVAALGIGPGDEVILPTFTIVSCALAVIYAGATPVLVDADPETWCLDTSQVEARITSRTRAIMPVHIYGLPVDMGPILRLARNHGLAVIEDAAEAHGAEYLLPDDAGEGWRRCGSFGEASCFSFYANKLVTTGEGGMILTDDEQLARRLRRLRNLAFEPERRFLHHEAGFNFRLTNVQAAMGLAQVERIAETVERKRAIGSAYAAALRRLTGVRVQADRDWARSVYWMNGLVLDRATGIDALTLAQRLSAAQVETRPFFLGMHRQPFLLERGLFAGESYPVADELADQGLYLPSGIGLSDADIATVLAATEAALA
jgi:perosamine synthetase